jgi:Pycsar effector protein
MRLWPWTRPAQPAQVEQNYEQYHAYSQLLDRNGQWIGVADTKTGVILGFLVATFPLLTAPALSAVQEVGKDIPHNANFWGYLPVAGLIALFVLFLVAALFTLVRVLMTLSPRLTRQGKPGLIFFGDVARQDYKQWQQRMLALDPHTLALQILEQVYATAAIADRKHVRQAIRALIVTILLGLALYVLSYLAR